MKKTARKTAGLLLTAVLLLSVGCADHTAVSPDESVASSLPETTVEFWTYCTTPEREQDFVRFQQTLKEWHPEITLNYLGIPGDISTFVQRLDIATASDTAPDFTDFYDSKYIESGFHEPFDAFYDHWSEKESLSADAILQARPYDPKQQCLYTLSSSMQPWGMWVRTDLLQSTGMGVLQTWDDFFTVAQKLTNREGDQYGTALHDSPDSSNTLEALMYAYSGFTDYFDKNGRCTTNSPKHTEFVERYLDLYNRYSVQDDLVRGWTQLTASFQAGKAGITFHNFGSGTSITTAFYGSQSWYQATELPRTVDDNAQIRFVMIRSVSMNSRSDAKEAAFQAMTVHCSTTMQIPHCKTQGKAPVVAGAALSPDYLDDNHLYLRLTERVASGKDGSVQTQVPAYLPQYTETQSEVEPMIQKVMAGSMSAKNLLDQRAKLLEAAKKQFDSTQG